MSSTIITMFVTRLLIGKVNVFELVGLLLACWSNVPKAFVMSPIGASFVVAGRTAGSRNTYPSEPQFPLISTELKDSWATLVPPGKEMTRNAASSNQQFTVQVVLPKPKAREPPKAAVFIIPGSVVNVPRVATEIRESSTPLWKFSYNRT